MLPSAMNKKENRQTVLEVSEYVVWLNSGVTCIW